MEKVKDFQELVSMSERELNEILGNDTNAKLLWNGLHGKLVQPVSSTSSSKVRGRFGKTKGSTKKK